MKTIAAPAMAAIEAGEAIVTGAVKIVPTATNALVGYVEAETSEFELVGAQSHTTTDGLDVGPIAWALTGGSGGDPIEGDTVVIEIFACADYGDTGANITPGIPAAEDYETVCEDSLPGGVTEPKTGLGVYLKVMGAVPDTGWSAYGTHKSGGTRGTTYHVSVWRGVHPSTIFAATALTTKGFLSALNPPDIGIGPSGYDPGAIATSSFDRSYIGASWAFLSATSGQVFPMMAGGAYPDDIFLPGNLTDALQTPDSGGAASVNCGIAYGRSLNPVYDGEGDPIYLWGGYGPIELDGDTYQGIGARAFAQQNAGAVGGVAQGLTLGISGIEPAALEVLDSAEIKSASVVLYRLIFASDGKTLLDAHIFDRGRVDTVEGEETIGGDATISVGVESAARGLGRSGGRRRSDSDQRLIDPDDGYFKNTAYAQMKTLYWGGKRPKHGGA